MTGIINRRSLSLLLGLITVVALLAACSGNAPASPTTAPKPAAAPAPTAAGAPAPTAAKAPASTNPIKLAYVNWQTGLGATYAAYGKAGAELAVEEINAKGGVLGRKIELLLRDEQGKPEVAAQIVKTLIKDDKVDGILGPYIGSDAEAVFQVADELKYPVLTPHSSTTTLTRERFSRYFFFLRSNGYMFSAAQVASVAKSPAKKLWMISNDYVFGRQTSADFLDIAKRTAPDLQMLGQSFAPVGEKDFAPYISQIMAAKPDGVVVNIYTTDLQVFLKQAGTLGLNIPMVGMLLDGDSIRPLGFDLPEGLWGFSQYEPELPAIPENQAFVQKYNAKYNDWPGWSSASLYGAVNAWTGAVAKVGAIDQEKIIDVFESGNYTWSSPFGTATMRPFDHIANYGMVVGQTKKNPKYPKWLTVSGEYIPGDKLMQPLDDVKAIRAAAQKK